MFSETYDYVITPDEFYNIRAAEREAVTYLKTLRRLKANPDVLRGCLLALRNGIRVRRRVGQFHCCYSQLALHEYKRHIANFYLIADPVLHLINS